MLVIRRLIWNPGNIAHIARHQVRPEQVAQVCTGPHIHRVTYGGRLMLIGPDQGAQVLAVVLEPLAEGAYYPVTARPASRKERRLYQEETGGEHP